jgi:hypothetical protein
MESAGKNQCRRGAIGCLLLLLAGCSDQEITAYRVPKDPGTTVAAVPAAMDQGQAPLVAAGVPPSENTNDLPHAGLMSAPSGAADGPSLRWQAPEGWQARPATAMRKGSYTINRDGAAADLSITAFPGDVGGLAANVNRWRGQIGLAPLEGAALAAGTETLDANGLHFTLIDFAGPTPGGRQRILAALASWQGATWFFKLMGPESMVENEKPDFTAFLRTVGPK